MVITDLRQFWSVRETLFLAHSVPLLRYKWTPTGRPYTLPQNVDFCVWCMFSPQVSRAPIIPLDTWHSLRPSVSSCVLHTELGCALCWGLRLHVFDFPHYIDIRLPGKVEITSHKIQWAVLGTSRRERLTLTSHSIRIQHQRDTR